MSSAPFIKSCTPIHNPSRTIPQLSSQLDSLNVTSYPFFLFSSIPRPLLIPLFLLHTYSYSSHSYLHYPQHTAPNNGGSTWGVNGCTGESADMTQLAIWEPYCVKTQTLKTAIERFEITLVFCSVSVSVCQSAANHDTAQLLWPQRDMQSMAKLLVNIAIDSTVQSSASHRVQIDDSSFIKRFLNFVLFCLIASTFLYPIYYSSTSMINLIYPLLKLQCMLDSSH